MTSLHDTIDRLADDVADAHRALTTTGAPGRSLQELCPEPAFAWAAETAVRGGTLPVNPATERALSGALTALHAAVQNG